MIIIGSQYTTAQAKAAKTYQKNFEDIKIRVPKGKRQEYKLLAESQGKSLNQFIIDCIENINTLRKEDS